MDTSIDTDWFKSKLADKRMSQRQLAKYLRLDSSAVSLTFRGKREMKLTEAAQIAQLVGVPVDEVLHHAGVLNITKGKRISVAYVMEAHGEVRTESEPFDVPAPADLAGDTYICCQARTAGTDLEHMDGWLMYLKQPKGVAPEAIGRFSMAKIRNGVTVVATVRKGYQPERYRLSGPFDAADVQLDWAQPIEHIRT